MEELVKKDVQVFILDKGGKDIREIEISKNCAFILGDQNGLPQKEIRRLKKVLEPKKHLLLFYK